MEIAEIRRSNLRRLVGRYESQLAFAEHAKLGVQYLNQLLSSHRNMGEKTARKIETALKLDLGWLDGRDDKAQEKTGLSPRATKIGQMFDRLPPDKQDALQKIVDALDQQVDPNAKVKVANG